MGKRDHYAGKKQRGGHTSIVPGAAKLVKWLDTCDLADGIAPGYIDSKARSRKPRLEFSREKIGVKVVCLGNQSKQTILIYTKFQDQLINLLTQKFNQ